MRWNSLASPFSSRLREICTQVRADSPGAGVSDFAAAAGFEADAFGIAGSVSFATRALMSAKFDLGGAGCAMPGAGALLLTMSTAVGVEPGEGSETVDGGSTEKPGASELGGGMTVTGDRAGRSAASASDVSPVGGTIETTGAIVDPGDGTGRGATNAPEAGAVGGGTAETTGAAG